MNHFDENIRRIELLATTPVQLMEVCGTHTVAISRSGIRSRLPGTIRLLSGPGCPVCVTPVSVIDTLIELADDPNVMLATFGDMLRVPGTNCSLQNSRTKRNPIKVVYSPCEALDVARLHPDKQIVFAGVGFETTLPVLAATIQRAQSDQLKNFSMLLSGRLALPAMRSLLQTDEVKIDGFISPGHVSAIIGSHAYQPLVDEFNVPCVIAGFEAFDILSAIEKLLLQIETGKARVENGYQRVVTDTGNRVAQQLMRDVFEIVDAEWRGIGVIPQSGVSLSENYSDFDAKCKFSISAQATSAMPSGCCCGEIMRGILLPTECPLFGVGCTPAQPVGPCMVSSEGSCAAYYRYDRAFSSETI